MDLAAAYMRVFCCPTPGARGCSFLLNGTGVLFVPFARASTNQTLAFSVVDPSVCNGLPLALRLLPGARVHFGHVLLYLKTVLFSRALLHPYRERF